MTMKHLFASAALVAGIALASSASAGVVLSDNFNSDTQGLNWSGDSVFNSVSAGSNASTDLIGTGFFDLYPGNGNYVDLDGSSGNGNTPTAGKLESILTFGAGTYTLSFDLGGNARGAANQTTVVSLGGTTIASLDLASSDALTNHTFTFTTAGGTLTFADLGPSDQQGNILDNVSLSAVPEPATWAMMLLGFFGLGAMLRSRPKFGTVAA